MKKEPPFLCVCFNCIVICKTNIKFNIVLVSWTVKNQTATSNVFDVYIIWITASALDQTKHKENESIRTYGDLTNKTLKLTQPTPISKKNQQQQQIFSIHIDMRACLCRSNDLRMLYDNYFDCGIFSSVHSTCKCTEPEKVELEKCSTQLTNGFYFIFTLSSIDELISMLQKHRCNDTHAVQYYYLYIFGLNVLVVET